MADSGRKGGMDLWPSLQTADRLFSVSNALLIVGLALTVVATVGVVWMANIREGYLKRELAEASAKGEEARAVAAVANERAAEANEKAETERLARIKLEAKIAPRRLSSEQRRRMVAALSASARHQFTITSRMLDTEGADFALDISAALVESNWHLVFFGKMWTRDIPGVSVGAVEGEPLDSISPLSNALDAAGIAHQIVNIANNDTTTIPETFRRGIVTILIGSKPQ